MRETIMSQTIESLWPDQIRPRVQSPNTMLKTQAAALAQQTAGVLLGEIILREQDKGVVGLEFNILVPALGGYRHRVLTIAHRVNLPYPAIVDAEVFRPESRRALQRFIEGVLEVTGALPPENKADSDKELLAIVARVLKSSQVLSAAQSLIARASDALGEEVQQPNLSQSSSAESSTVYQAEAQAENTDDQQE